MAADQQRIASKGPRWQAPVPVRELTPASAPEAFSKVTSYLEKFGYLAKGASHDAQSLSVALKNLQQVAKLPETGIYDAAVQSLMGQPRCGIPDVTGIVPRFVASGTKWDHMALTYRFDGFCEELTAAQCRQAFSQAAAQWSAVTPLSFTEVTGSTPADIRVLWAKGDHGDGWPFDGIGTVLAHGFYPPPNGGEIAGDIHFDDAETWNLEFAKLVALHELGHALGLKHSATADSIMWPYFNISKKVLHPDDIAGIHALYGTRLPRWKLLTSVPISIAASGTELFQLQRNGWVYRKVSDPRRGWQIIDDWPGNAQITTSAGKLFLRHSDGRIYRYTGTPMTGWQLIGNNPATVDILAADSELYQRHGNGLIWRYTGTPITGWQLLDNNPKTVQIAADGGRLYQRHNDGKIWRYTGTPLTGWEVIDNNAATVHILASDNELYQRHNDGKIWRYTGPPITGWQLLDNNEKTVGIMAAGKFLFQMHNDGAIWRYYGTPISGWERLDANPAARQIAALDNGMLYQLQSNGQIWQLLD